MSVTAVQQHPQKLPNSKRSSHDFHNSAHQLHGYSPSLDAASTQLFSPLLQASLLCPILPRQHKLLVLSTPHFKRGHEHCFIPFLTPSCSDLHRCKLLKADLQPLPGFATPTAPAFPLKTPLWSHSSAWTHYKARERASVLLVGYVREAVLADNRITCILVEDPSLSFASPCLRKELGLAVFDAVTMMELCFSTVCANPKFGMQFASKSPLFLPHRPKEAVIGIVRVDHHYTFLPGNIPHAESHSCPIRCSVVKGLTFKIVQKGLPLSKKQRFSLGKALSAFRKERSVRFLAGDSGFLVNYQEDLQEISNLPSLSSAMMQCKLIATWFPQGTILVVSANSESLQSNLSKILQRMNLVDQHISRFAVVGAQNIPGFEAAMAGPKFSPSLQNMTSAG